MARFVRKPTTKVILPNEIATFDCSVVGMGLLYLNGHVLSDSFNELALKGLRYSIEETSDGLRTFTSMKLTVEGLPANNGSLIDCYGYNENVIHSSSLLIIAGNVQKAACMLLYQQFQKKIKNPPPPPPPPPFFSVPFCD